MLSWNCLDLPFTEGELAFFLRKFFSCKEDVPLVFVPSRTARKFWRTVCAAQICLFLSFQRLPASPEVTVAKAALPTGALLFIKTDASATIAAVPLQHAAPMTTADLPPETATKNLSSPSSSSASSSAYQGGQGASAGSGDSGVAGVNFKSFDAFLRERKFAVNDLPGCTSYKPRRLEAGRMNKVSR
uniref:NPL4 family protein n=1 Tax=Toxoplasma gondii TgCATBr9 TaxID=943120 RepID=A0A2T6J3P8_TOXGO|nr:NPL4 family protein [Toxoplasma gondii TgCATBr9]